MTNDKRVAASDDAALAAVLTRNYTFAYPNVVSCVLSNVCLRIPQGSFTLLCGKTGSGKTTLLRLLKPQIAPAGKTDGDAEVFGHALAELAADPRLSAGLVGFVFQSPDNQIVCDTVWRELAFGLENLGVDPAEMRRRIAETCYFLGIEPWFRKKTNDLSGGQRQILALASALVMRPRLLLLDEPTSMLDPIAEQRFLALLARVNRELGVTVVVATHRPGPMLPFATDALQVEGGGVRPVPLDAIAQRSAAASLPSRATRGAEGAGSADGPAAVRLRDVWYRYSREDEWVLRGCSLSVRRGEVHALVGGNGCGKSTLLNLVAMVAKPQRGHVDNGLRASQALLPQNPKALLTQETVEGELMEWSRTANYSLQDAHRTMDDLGLSLELLRRHPYDLSGGQQQLLALAKLLLTQPDLLILDEPTKGLDDDARAALARAVNATAAMGATVLLSTHDMGLVRTLADRVTMLFDGQVAASDETEAFFQSSWLWL